MTKRLLFALLGTLAFGPAAFPMTFTGTVPADFAGTGVVIQDDAVDVGLPVFAPMGTVSGWDVDEMRFELDRDLGLLHVGFNFYGIGGDADGNGLDGHSSDWLLGRGGVDNDVLAGSESICIAFDFDQDGNYDLIAGVGPFGSTYSVASFNAAFLPFGLNACFGAPLPQYDGGSYYAPHTAPDFELSLAQLGDFEDLDALVLCFDYKVYCGSTQDDGVGEDFVEGEICFTDDGQVEAQPLPVSPDLIRAFPNPFNPTTTLAVELAETGHVDLSIFNLQGQQVATLVNGLLSAGTHQVAFNAGNLPSGLYLARLSTVSGQQVSRLVLTK